MLGIYRDLAELFHLSDVRYIHWVCQGPWYKFIYPQDTVFGSILFRIYVNDLCISTNNGNIMIFTDDKNVFVKSNYQISLKPETY